MIDSRLYILMRDDMTSMNAGKAMAQAAHAANAFVHDMEEATRKDNSQLTQHTNHWRAWQRQTPQGFGTTITLAVSGQPELSDMISVAKEHGYPAGVIHDPSYPVRDGAITHLIPIDTCGYIFVPDANERPPYMSLLPLHP